MAAGQDNFNILRDPLQGYDIKIETVKLGLDGSPTSEGLLVGRFTSLMFKIVNQTETYLPVNSRIPRMLDGELIVVWSLEQGLVNLKLIANTFGLNFAQEFASGRGQLIPRSARFNIKFNSNLSGNEVSTTTDKGLNIADPLTATPTGITKAEFNLQKTIEYCRVDTYSFGVTSGRNVVANAWQGTGQHIK